MSKARFTILHKGLLLIGGPLAFQLLFIALFLWMQAQEKSAQDWLVHTRDVIEQTEQTFRILAEDFSATRGAVLMGIAPPTTARSDTQVLQEIDTLGGMVRDNPQQVARVDAYRAAASDLILWINQIDDLLRQGKKAEAASKIAEPAAAQRMHDLENTMGDMLLTERTLWEARLGQLELARHRIRWLLGLSGCIGALLALGVLWVFSQNIARRMNALTTNAEAIGKRGALGPLLRGSDEIAIVDEALHHAAQQLNELVTVEQRHRGELEHRADELTRLNRDLDFKTQENETFVYSVSHDLRSPLVNLQGFSKELTHACEELRTLVTADSIADPPKKKLLAVIDGEINVAVRFIQTAVSRSAGIIDALLRLSRVGRVEYNSKVVSVADTVKRVVEAMQGTIRQRGAQIVIKDLPDALGDPTAIEQIFGNLIGNAVNYLDPKRAGQIEIGSLDGVSGDKVGPNLNVYYVRDNGLGIAAAYLPKMFVAFQRLHGTMAAGEGIGLAMARRMVERQGGKIWVESQENVGTSFFVALPSVPHQDFPEAAQNSGTKSSEAHQ